MCQGCSEYRDTRGCGHEENSRAGGDTRQKGIHIYIYIYIIYIYISCI